MSNNLRQIAKDLRSFVKRCKDVHYSDSLLITFLVTGMLTIAPKTLRADVVQEQQEVSSQAYESIMDLRQSFLRARQENEKSLKGAERELVMLMEQGEHVIKSPWASFQYATGFTNNDWRTSYRGRGGKYLEYFRRNNDLTKYVFDAKKNAYGATRLNLPRNQEPNSLAINPANIHEPYRPYEIDRLDSLSLPTAPEYTYAVESPVGTNVSLTPSNNFTHTRRTLTTTVDRATFSLDNNNTGNGTGHKSWTYLSNTSNTVENAGLASNSSVGTANGGSASTAAGVNPSVSATMPTKATFLTANSAAIPQSEVYNLRRWARYTNPMKFSTITQLTGGTFYLGNADSEGKTVSGWFYGGAGGKAKIRYDNVSTNVSSDSWGEDDDSGGTGSTVTITASSSAVTDVNKWLATRLIAGNPGLTWSEALTAATTYSGAYHSTWGSGPTHRMNWSGFTYAGVTIPGGNFDTSMQYTYYDANHTGVNAAVHATSTMSNFDTNTFHIGGSTARIGLAVGGGTNSNTVTANGNRFEIESNSGHNAVAVFRTSNTVGTYNDTSSSYILESGASGSNGIYNEGGYVNLTTPTFNIASTGSNGILNKAGASTDGKLTTNGGQFYVSGAGSNIITNLATATTKDGNFIVDATGSNAIYSNKELTVRGGTFELRSNGSNLIVNTGTGNALITNTTGNREKFTLNLNATGSSAIYNGDGTKAATLSVAGREFEINSKNSNAINNSKASTTKIQDNIFTIDQNDSNAIRNDGSLYLLSNGTDKNIINLKRSGNTGIYNDQNATTLDAVNFEINITEGTSPVPTGSNGIVNVKAKPISLRKGSIVVSQKDSNGIMNLDTGTIDTYKVDIDINRRNSNGINNHGKGTITTELGTITVNATNSNGIRSNDGTVKTKKTDFVLTTNATSTTAPLTEGANGITSTGVVETEDGTFTINSARSNGIYINSTGKNIKSTGTHFHVNNNYSNGINIQDAAKLTIGYNFGTGTTPTFIVGNSGGNPSYSNGIYTKKGILDVSNASFTVKGTGSRNNGIFIDTGATGAHVISNTHFNVESGESNGLRILDGASLGVSGGSFTNTGNSNNGIYLSIAGQVATVNGTNFYLDGGTNSNGIYALGGKLDLKNGTVRIGSVAPLASGATSSNGVYVVGSSYGGAGGATGDKVTISNMTFDVNTSPALTRDANNTGIYVGNDRTIASITNTTINVNGNANGKNGNIGILVGDSYTAQAKIEKIENTTINIDSTNGTSDGTGTGIFMYNGDVNIGKATQIQTASGDAGNDVFITIRNRDYNNTLTMEGESGSGQATGITGYGANNIGINIQSGHNVATLGKTLTITQGTANKGWNISLTGGANNVGILNNAFADTFTLSNELNYVPVASNDTGVIRISGNRGIGYENLGYVNDGKLRLDYVSMNGTNSAILAFNNRTYQNNRDNNTFNQINRTNVDSGVFNLTGTNKISVQGVIGADTGSGLDSNGSVGVYANTGQRSDLTKGIVGFIGADQLSDLKFGGLNIGLNEKANDSTVIWSENGTKVVVAGNHYTTNGGANLVSDGVNVKNGTSDFGYNVPDKVTSKNSVYAYATGTFNGRLSGYYNLPSAAFRSEIDTTAVGVDLVSREGTALLATKGGKVTSANVRAGGYRSIIGYADGQDAINANASSILIKGQMIAADNNLLNTTVNDGAGNLNGLLVATDSKLANTYQNIGAVAIDGGSVVIENAGRSASSKEGTTTSPAGANSSLIYGMGAYARGTVDANNPTNKISSSVRFSKESATKKGNITVISGEHGALFAEKNGQIYFAGDIINQNNVGNTVSTKSKVGSVTQAVTGVDLTSPVARYGRGNGVGVANDHTNTTPFYVNRGAYEGRSDIDNAGITFNDQAIAGYTNIDMYDGILLSGNVHGGNGAGAYTVGQSYELIRDYYAKDTADSGGKYNRAKYRGMENVKAAIMNDDYAVQLGIINQPSGKLVWNNLGNTNAAGTSPTGTASYLDSIGKFYAEGMQIQNKKFATAPNTATDTNTDVGNRFKSTILNGHLVISADKTNLEDVKLTSNNDSSKLNDPFNDISMESTIIEINATKEVFGDIATGYRAGQGLSMANSLRRWRNLDGDVNGKSVWEKTSADQSGIINSGKINVWGGTRHNGTKVDIAGINVIFGTAQNKTGAEITVDHGYGIFATDSSNISNSGEITITGKYNANSSLSTLRANRGFSASAESTPSGENYGIVGISDARATYDKNADESISYNKINILNIDGKINAEGDLAVGIYAENRGNALRSDINVTYNDAGLSVAGIDVKNANVTNNDARGVGIAVVNSNRNYNAATNATNAGGNLTLNSRSNTNIGQFGANNNNILTGKNGVGIFAEATNITLNSNTFTVETKDNGVGLWGMDATNVAVGTNSSHLKKFQYNYNGANDKNAFAMAFGSRNNSLVTTARNDLDILFSNKAAASATNKVNLVNERTNSHAGTSKGIAGILVNTGLNTATPLVNDTVINKGNIEEDSSSVTNLRAYGAVVNRGNFINWGDIKLNESLMPAKASDVTREDMKKVNVGIRSNNMDRYSGSIEHHGDIKIGDTTSGKSNTTSARNIGSWSIYGHNITTGAKADGTNSLFVVNRNSYGIYSGDGNVEIKKSDIKVGNDTVLGHIQPTGLDVDGNPYTLTRQQSAGVPNGYAQPNDLLSQLGRERDSAIGVYIDSNRDFSNTSRNVNVSANMEIDRFSHGIVLAERTGGRSIGNYTNVTIGEAGNAPVIKLAYSTDNNQGGHVKSTKPTENPARRPLEIYEQGNSVYYYSADDASDATSYANVTMDGDYNTAYYTKGSVVNKGTIDLRSQYDLAKRSLDPTHEAVGYGNVGIISENTAVASKNYGTITTGLSDTVNLMYSVGMGAGRNHYRTNNKGETVYDRTSGQGNIENHGVINVQEKAGIGMLATGKGSIARNYGTINLIGDSAIGMYIDRGAMGVNESTGVITGNAQNLKGVIAINGGFIKNYGVINVTGTGSTGIVTDKSKFVVDGSGNVIHVTSEDSRYATAKTAGELNGKTDADNGRNDGKGATDLYGGSESSIVEGSNGNPKTTGVGTTITRPDIVPLTTVTIDGVQVPITNIDTDAKNIGEWARNITLTNSIQTGGTRIIDLSTRDEFGNPAWPSYRTNQLSEVTNIGMYVDTSGVRYTNPINGIENLTHLGKVDLYFGTEATMYTNAKALRFGDITHPDGTIERSSFLKPFNDALRRLPGGATVNPLSASLTWQVSANIDDNNQIRELYMSKVPYHSFAFDDDKSLINFTNNLDNLYEIARPGSEEKMIFNKLNSLGNGEGHILAQAFDQMRGHIYGGIQQRTKATSDILSGEVAQLRSERNATKDSNKFKAFGQKNEYKTDTAGQPDWESNAGGFVYLHGDETVRLGEGSGFYVGAVNNYFTFKDLARSYENQAMLKSGLYKQTPLDEYGTFTLTIGGDGFFGRTNTKRRYWVVDKEFRAKSDYYTYGAGVNANLQKVFRLNKGFSITPSIGLNFEYGRFSGIHEDGDMALDIKSDDYYSIKPKAGIDFSYSQPVFKNTNFTANLGFSYENELGRINNVENEARIRGAWTDYYTIKGDKEDRRGNFKSDLKFGLDNGRVGLTVNTGYDTQGHNFKAGLGLKLMY
ncbi:autotransporter-associated N-terminal domain-containing protein [Leptotrichia sp. oral taxon 879]|uniref:autotransporter-associated N-terminal domain-containing protein n=1 Tax=Leptotrichia sp. oral taxon 879 TaxID=1227267 RepID=UPI0004263825|nr:autotransporter-associated N-terminal domain-containing protein [Leptotrichia sp. oral taxon 879]